MNTHYLFAGLINSIFTLFAFFVAVVLTWINYEILRRFFIESDWNNPTKQLLVIRSAYAILTLALVGIIALVSWESAFINLDIRITICGLLFLYTLPIVIPLSISFIKDYIDFQKRLKSRRQTMQRRKRTR